jgi:predicted lipoprotein with Yx(FWY)xxD motif
MTAPKIPSLGNRSRARRLSSGPARLRILLALPAAAAAAAALAACSSSGAATTPSSSASSSPAASSASSSPAASPASSSPAGSSSAASGSAAAAAVGLKTASIGGVTVLTNAKGFALYTFAPDTATKSACNGACAAAWPPQPAPAAVKSPYSTIKRSDGSAQLAFNGHPLYTYIADTAPGTATGNGVNAFGGLWKEVPASGAAAPASTTSTSSGSVGY